jgi:hypothetical protein
MASTRESHSKHKVRTHSSDTFVKPQFYNVEYSSYGSRKDCIVQQRYTITLFSSWTAVNDVSETRFNTHSFS